MGFKTQPRPEPQFDFESIVIIIVEIGSLDIDIVVRHHDSGDAKMFPIGKFAGNVIHITLRGLS